MLDKELMDYFDGIEPDNELVERMIAMSNESKNKKRIKLSTKIIAVIAAVICIAAATTATAAIIRINNDKNGIVGVRDTNNSFILDFAKAQRTPEKLSDTDNDIVKTLEEKGFRDVIIPSVLIHDGYKISNANPFLPHYTSGIFDFAKDDINSVSATIIQDVSDEDVSGLWGTGNENSTGEIINVNGMDVVVVYMGDETIGFVSYIFYANANTIYQFSLETGLDEQSVKDETYAFVNSLAQ